MKMLALLLAVMAWAGTSDRVAGRYALEDSHEMVSELVLKPGGQFEYTLMHGAASYKTAGKWRVTGDAVVLNSKVSDAPSFKLVRSMDLRSPDVRVWVKARNGAPVANLDVDLTTPGGDVMARTDRDGMAIFPVGTEPKSVVIRTAVYNKDSGTVALNPVHTDFTFELNSDALATVPFHNEALKITGDTLEMLYWDKTKPLVYRKR